jgi:hypothetical protein
MPKPTHKLKQTKRRTLKYHDANQFAHDILQQTIAKSEEATEPRAKEAEVDPALLSQVMRQIGSKGAEKGGKRRMAMLTPKERSALGTKAIQARWAKKKKAS